MTEPKELSIEQVKERSTRFARRLGYVVFMGTGLLIFIPMILAVASGIKNEQIWDPETGRAVIGGRQEMDCSEEARRSEEHTSELQSRPHLVCRLLLEKKKKIPNQTLFTMQKHSAT